MIYLNSNEGAAPSMDLFERLRTLGPEVLRRYPDAKALERRLADRFAITPDRVLVTAGGDDAIDRVCRAYLGTGREIILPSPTFEMIPRYAALSGANIVDIPWHHGVFPIAEFCRAVNERTAVIAIVSPNNPTGATATRADIRGIAEAAPKALLLIDLAYTEFAKEDLTATALEQPNAIAIRTLSKAYGLAGLRIGAVLGPAPILRELRRCGAPYAVAGPSLAIACARLDMEDEDGGATTNRFVTRVAVERERLFNELRALGCDALPSQGNFVLARFPDAKWAKEGLAGLGIAVRSFPDRPELSGDLRITCPGDPKTFAQLIAALGATLAPQTLLLDMNSFIPVDLDGPATLFAELADRLPLAMVTDRSRHDAERFIAENGIANSFKVVVTAEDGPEKTNSTRMGQALARLEVDRGWMISGTPSVVRAARVAGVVPLGIVASADDDRRHTSLLEAGAARVLTSLTEILELLP